MNTWNERLAFAMESSGVVAAKMSKALSVSTATISDWRSGKIKNMEADNAINVSNYLNIKLNWLIKGKLPSGIEQLDLNVQYKNYEPDPPLVVKTPLPVFNAIKIEGKEIKPNEIALLDMYVKLSPESKEMVDYIANKLYAMEYPNDKVAAPFSKHHKKPN